MSILPCQIDMLRTRQNFPNDVRVYTCAPKQLAAAIVGPADDLEMLAEVCATQCAKERPDPTVMVRPGRALLQIPYVGLDQADNVGV